MGSLPEEDKRRVFSPTPFPWPSLRGARIAIPQRGRGPPVPPPAGEEGGGGRPLPPKCPRSRRAVPRGRLSL